MGEGSWRILPRPCLSKFMLCAHRMVWCHLEHSDPCCAPALVADLHGQNGLPGARARPGPPRVTVFHSGLPRTISWPVGAASVCQACCASCLPLGLTVRHHFHSKAMPWTAGHICLLCGLSASQAFSQHSLWEQNSSQGWVLCSWVGGQAVGSLTPWGTSSANPHRGHQQRAQPTVSRDALCPRGLSEVGQRTRAR